MNKLAKTGVIGAIMVIIVFIIVGVMLVKSAKEQSSDISDDGTKLTISFGNAFIFAGVIGILLLVIIGLAWLSKYV